MYNIAVILAGGTGTRAGAGQPKQFRLLPNGQTVLETCVTAFETNRHIDEIAIVMHPDWIEEAQRLCLQNGWQKVQKIIQGGNERWESSWHAVQAYNGDKLTVNGERIALWFHDAARPFVSQQILSDVAEALNEHKAVTVAVPMTDTIYSVKNNGEWLRVNDIPSRMEYMRAQTPQAFYLDIIQTAFERAFESGDIIATDDAGIVHKYIPEQSIYIVTGTEANKKITYSEDLK